MTKAGMLAVAVAVVAVAGPTAWALDVGDKMPALSVKQWVVGRPVTANLVRGKVVVVEFWATWCGPCRTTIPHLNKLHEKYRDKQVVVCGITREDANTVKPFLKQVPMKYHVGVDTGKTHELYMKGIPGIPHAYVVDQSGKVAWHGHPMAGMDQVVEKLVAQGGSAGGGSIDVEGMDPIDASLALSTSDDVAARDLDKALELARKAFADSGKKSAKALAAVARVHYEMGHLDVAARAAEAAAGLATGDEAEALKAAAAWYRKELERRRADAQAKL